MGAARYGPDAGLSRFYFGALSKRLSTAMLTLVGGLVIGPIVATVAAVIGRAASALAPEGPAA